MSKIKFNEEQIKKLSNNPYVKNISNKSITYSDEFKRIFIEEYNKGNLPRDIFEKYGFDIDIIGIRRIETAAYRWKQAYNTEGVLGLKDTRKTNSGRPRTKHLTIEQKYERLLAQNQLLKAENELLKKLDALERGLI